MLKRIKVHFAALFCVDVDNDLLTHWIEHYSNFHFDSYTIYLNSQREDDEPSEKIGEAAREFIAAGWKTETIDGPFNNGGLRIKALEPFRASLNPYDKLVVADSDEFHDFDPHEYYDIIVNNDLVMGELVDRYDKTIHKADPTPDPSPKEGGEKTLWEQYPYSGCVEREAINALDEPYKSNMLNSWPFVRKDKIMACNANYKVGFTGSHALDVPAPSNAKIHYGNTVWHFSWRESILKRMMTKTYYNADHIWAILNFFGLDENYPEFQEVINREAALQEQKGWIPQPA